MPQLEIGDFAPQLVWLALSFAALYIIMARIALPRIATVIEERRDRIASDLDRAEQLREETEQAIATYEQALAEARAKAHAIAQETRAKVAADIDRQRTEIEARLAEQTAEAERRIRSMKDDALSHVEVIAAEAADALVARLTGESVSRSDISAAVNETLGN